MNANQSERIGIIDLGSNTARLVVMQSWPGYAYRLEDEIREVVRLRQGITAAGLNQAAIARAMFALRLFKRYCDSSKVDGIIATATSAVREAANGSRFVAQVRSELDLDLRVLGGEQEAYYAAVGVLNEVPLENGYVLDIGGGSIQLAEVRERSFRRGQSLPLGSLTLTERFIEEDPVSQASLAVIAAEIESQLDSISWLPSSGLSADAMLVGLGGTIRNLAKMDAARQSYPLNTLHGYELTLASVQESLILLRELPFKERQRLPGLSRDRADILLPGAMTLEAIMRRLQADALVVSRNGLREGLFLERFWTHLSEPIVANVRRFGVLNMARVYRYQKNHANHVRYLAGRLFDQLAPLHGYGDAERELLDAAALLHDLGNIIAYNDHHKHSQTLIVNSGLPGFSPREIALVALLARYHRKGTPDTTAYQLVLKCDDKQRLTHLAAILRLAEFLERGRNANVDDVTVAWTGASLRLTLVADEYPAVELWETERNAVDLLASTFGRDVILESTAVPDISGQIGEDAP